MPHLVCRGRYVLVLIWACLAFMPVQLPAQEFAAEPPLADGESYFDRARSEQAQGTVVTNTDSISRLDRMPIRLVQRSREPVPAESREAALGDPPPKQEVAPEQAVANAVGSLPLAPPRSTSNLSSRPAALGSSGALVTVAGSLAVVLGAFFLVVWLARRALPKAATGLPREALEVLGQAPLHGRQIVQLLRVGKKLLLVAVTPTSIQTLTEVTDVSEVERLAALCRGSQSDSVTAAFRQVLGQFGQEASVSRATSQQAASRAASRAASQQAASQAAAAPGVRRRRPAIEV